MLWNAFYQKITKFELPGRITFLNTKYLDIKSIWNLILSYRSGQQNILYYFCQCLCHYIGLCQYHLCYIIYIYIDQTAVLCNIWILSYNIIWIMLLAWRIEVTRVLYNWKHSWACGEDMYLFIWIQVDEGRKKWNWVAAV